MEDRRKTQTRHTSGQCDFPLSSLQSHQPTSDPRGDEPVDGGPPTQTTSHRVEGIPPGGLPGDIKVKSIVSERRRVARIPMIVGQNIGSLVGVEYTKGSVEGHRYFRRKNHFRRVSQNQTDTTKDELTLTNSQCLISNLRTIKEYRHQIVMSSRKQGINQNRPVRKEIEKEREEVGTHIYTPPTLPPHTDTHIQRHTPQHPLTPVKDGSMTVFK